MNVEEAMKRLESLGHERTRAQNSKLGAGDNQFGVKLGDIRKLAKEIKSDHALGRGLWATGNIDARFLGILLLTPKEIPGAELDAMVRSVSFTRVADWLNSYVVGKHPAKEELREPWMDSGDGMAERAGWHLTSERVAKKPEGLELDALLDRLEAEMPKAAPEAQWTMNFCLTAIGIHSEAHRERAIAIGEALGLYRDYPVSKGCTSPFAPIAIRELVRRQG